MKSTFAKVGVGFLLGATMVGGIATAATNSTPSLKACVDNRTQALYLSKDGSCSKTRTLVDLSSGGLNAKSVAAAVTPSVVSIQVTTSTGSGNGSGSIYKTSATSSYIITNNHVVEDAARSLLNYSMEISSMPKLLAEMPIMILRLFKFNVAIFQ